MSFMSDGGGNIGSAFWPVFFMGDMPNNMGFGDIASAIRVDAHEVILRESGGKKKDLVNKYKAGDILFGGAIDDPEKFTSVCIITGDALAAAENKLGDPGEFFCVDKDRGAIASGFVGTIDAPFFFTGVFFVSHDISFSILIAIEDYKILVKNRGRAETMS